jgi:exopolysaccharide biosynthesis protein
MKHYLFFFLLLPLSSLAQNDSLTFISTKWETQTIAPGITWMHYHFDKNLFHSNQNINILDIRLKGKRTIAFACEPKTLRTVSDFGKTSQALAAINGNFFDTKNGGSEDYIKVHDSVISTNKLWGTERARHQRAGLAIRKGKLRIAKWDGSATWEAKLKEKDVLLTGPLLLWEGSRQPLDTGEFNHARHPRSAIATFGKKHVVFITIDGRNENAAGMSLYELADIMKWLKVQNGINMDGGGSTTLWISNQPGNGVVNYPTDNKKWDHEGERKVANVVLVK